MLHSSRIELAIYRYIKSVGTRRSTAIGELAAAIGERHEDVAERLRYLHSEGHATLWKYAGHQQVPYSEEANVLFSAQDFLFRGGFEIEITPAGRKYFEELEGQQELEGNQTSAAKASEIGNQVEAVASPQQRANAISATEGLTFETAFHAYGSDGIIGEGGAGTVFRVRDEDGQAYAIKRLDPRKATSQKTKRFRQS